MIAIKIEDVTTEDLVGIMREKVGNPEYNRVEGKDGYERWRWEGNGVTVNLLRVDGETVFSAWGLNPFGAPNTYKATADAALSFSELLTKRLMS
jgi:hypothetical protein